MCDQVAPQEKKIELLLFLFEERKIKDRNKILQLSKNTKADVHSSDLQCALEYM